MNNGAIKRLQHRFRPLSGNLLSLRRSALPVTPRRSVFSSPIGESTFSTMTQSAKKNTKASFRPLSGNLLSLQIVSEYSYGDNIVFVPYRGIYFLYEIKEGCTMYDVDRFRPLSGNLLSLLNNVTVKYAKKEFSSPIGESTFSTTIR